MAYVNIKITDEGLSKEQRAALLKGLTTHLQQTLKNNPGTTLVVIDELNTGDWGLRREPFAELRLQVA